jgi:CheY-like chemotaxis protein
LLLVEDDPFVRLALTRALNRTGVFSVTPAENGERALAVLDQQAVDAILTDLQMPVMDGLTLLSHLLERGIPVPVAVMTGQGITPELAERLHRYGIAASFTKPVNLGTLTEELQRAVSPATVGRIAGITLFGFLQLLEVEGKTALIVVHSAGAEGRLYFERGTLIHGEARQTTGLVAVYDILSWPEPKLEIFYDRTCRDRTVEEPLQHVLMEAARLLDERSRTAVARDPEVPSATVEADLPLPPELQGVLQDAMQIQGARGAAVADVGTGLSLASAGVVDFVPEKLRAIASLGVEDSTEDVLLTVGNHYHLVRFLGSPQKVFLYLALDREQSNLGTARRRLADLARQLTRRS